MKELEDHLRSLRSDYHAVKYPGDLAVDVPLSTGRGWKIGGLMAIAAILALGVVMWMATTPTVPTNEIVHSPPAQLPDVTPQDAVAEAIAPTDLAGSVPTWSGITGSTEFSMPSFPEVQSASMPYGSLSVPTVSEIDKHLQQLETTGNEQT